MFLFISIPNFSSITESKLPPKDKMVLLGSAKKELLELKSEIKLNSNHPDASFYGLIEGLLLSNEALTKQYKAEETKVAKDMNQVKTNNDLDRLFTQKPNYLTININSLEEAEKLESKPTYSTIEVELDEIPEILKNKVNSSDLSQNKYPYSTIEIKLNQLSETNQENTPDYSTVEWNEMPIEHEAEPVYERITIEKSNFKSPYKELTINDLNKLRKFSTVTITNLDDAYKRNFETLTFDELKDLYTLPSTDNQRPQL